MKVITRRASEAAKAKKKSGKRFAFQVPHVCIYRRKKGRETPVFLLLKLTRIEAEVNKRGTTQNPFSLFHCTALNPFF